MKVRKTGIVVATIVCVLILASVASAAGPEGIGTPTLRVNPGGNTQTAVIFADGITDGGSAGNGAIGWDIYLTVPNTIGLADFSVTAGSAWTSACPGTFNVSKVTQASTVVGQNAFLVSGVCLVPQTSVVTGNNVEVATLTFTSSCTATGNFNVNLDVGPQNDSTDMFDLLGEVYIFPANALTDGGALCGPTAVSLSGIQADNAPNNTAQYGALLALVLVAAVAAGAFVVLRRRNTVA